MLSDMVFIEGHGHRKGNLQRDEDNLNDRDEGIEGSSRRNISHSPLLSKQKEKPHSSIEDNETKKKSFPERFPFCGQSCFQKGKIAEIETE